MNKIVCNCCSTKHGKRYMVLKKGYYDCGCGYSISHKCYTGDGDNQKI
jgi:hypothetical protein